MSTKTKTIPTPSSPFNEGCWYAPCVNDNGVSGGPGKYLLLLLDRVERLFFVYNNIDGGGFRVTLPICQCNNQTEKVSIYGVTYFASDKATLCGGTPVWNTCKKFGLSMNDSSEAIMTASLLEYKPKYV